MTDGPRLARAGELIQRLHAQVAVLEETNSFLIATTAEPLTVGNEWVQVSGLVLGPYSYETDEPDLTLSETADTITCHRRGKYHLLVNCQFVSATEDGWFESAIEPVGGHTPIWPTEINNGHTGVWVPAAAIGWAEATLGQYAAAPWPLDDNVEITATMKYVTATGTGTIDVSALMFATRLGR